MLESTDSSLAYLSYSVYGIPVYSMLLSFVILVAAFFAKAVAGQVVGVYIRGVVARTRFHLDDVLVGALSTPVSWAVAVLGIYIALWPLNSVVEQYRGAIGKIFGAIVAFLVMVFFLRLVDGIAEYLRPKFHSTETKLDDAILPAMKTAAKIVVVIITVLWVLQKFDQNVSTILAGLGVGGLAVALAAQGTLSNWFGAFMIFSDRPFAAGDRIVIDNYDGFVEQVGLRSTRIRTLDGTLVTIPNATVANAQINNISRIPARKSNFTIGVTYDTSPEKMEEALATIKDILETNAKVRKDYVVKFESFGDFSLNIRVIFWALTVDYGEWLDVVEHVNLAVLKRFNAAGIEFAFPSQTLYVKQAS